jgi:hypothetical protein
MAIVWVIVPAVLIGWVAGFFSWHVYAAIIWGLCILIIYPRFRRRWGVKVNAFSYFLALIQAGIGGFITYIIGAITH